MPSKSSIKPPDGISEPGYWHGQAVWLAIVCVRGWDRRPPVSGMEAVWAGQECQGCQSLHERLSLSLSLSLVTIATTRPAEREQGRRRRLTAYTAARNANGQNQSCSNVFLTIQNLVTLLFFEINGIRIHPKFYCDSRLWPFVKEVRFFLWPKEKE